MNKKSIWISVGFHVGIILIATVSLPWIKRDFEIPPPISIELAEIAPITQTDKIAPKPAPKKEEPKEEPPKPPPAATNTASEAAKPVPKPPEPEPKKEEPPKKDEVLVDEAAPPEKKKTKQEEKKKEVTKPKPEPKKDFSSVLKNLQVNDEKEAPKQELPDLKLDETAASDGAKAPLGAKMTMSEEDALRRQLEACWNVPIGAKDAQDLRVEVFMVINQDRTLREARVVDQSRYNSDSFYRAAADSALRAVRNPACSPFQLPPDKYDVWKTVTVTFDPSQMF
jgi:hypothetical protein